MKVAMRTVLVVVAVTALLVTGCADTRRSLVVAPDQAGPTAPAHSALGDPAITRKVCLQAMTVVARGTAYFNSQFAALERAAARGDQTGIVAAAEAMNTRFVQMAAALATAARKQVSPGLKAVLRTGSALLSEILSPAYAGATTDVAKRLADVAAALVKACG
jgi:hypothetical protein